MITPDSLEVEPTGAFLLKHINGGRNLTFYDNKDSLPAGWTQHELVLKPEKSVTQIPILGKVAANVLFSGDTGDLFAICVDETLPIGTQLYEKPEKSITQDEVTRLLACEALMVEILEDADEYTARTGLAVLGWPAKARALLPKNPNWVKK